MLSASVLAMLTHAVFLLGPMSYRDRSSAREFVQRKESTYLVDECENVCWQDQEDVGRNLRKTEARNGADEGPAQEVIVGQIVTSGGVFDGEGIGVGGRVARLEDVVLCGTLLL